MKCLSVPAVCVLVVLSLALNANAAVVSYVAYLDGPSEDPPVASPGTGIARVDFDAVAHTMRVRATFSDLIGTTTVAHIHAPTAVAGTGTAGVATTTPTFPGFPVGVTSGSYDMTFDLTLASSYNPAYVTANGGVVADAEAALGAALAGGKAYFNLHTSFVPAGEIRGFFAVAVPEPAGAAVMGAMLIAAGARRRRRGAVSH